MVDSQGRLEVQLIGSDPRLDYLAAPKSLRVYGVRSHYALNFARGFLVVYMQLLLVAMLALAGSTFLSAPVAIVQALFIYLVGHLLDILRSFAEALGQQQHSLLEEIFGGGDGHGHAHGGEEHIQQLSASMRLIKEVLLQFCNWFPDFSRYDVSPLLVERIEIPAAVLLDVSLYSLGYAAVFGLMGLVVFNLRQVDRA